MRVHAANPSQVAGGKPSQKAHGARSCLLSAPGRYAVALASSLVALLIQQALWPFMRTAPFLFSYLAIMIAGWWGGWGPAIASIALATLGVVFRGLLTGKPLQRSPGEALSLALFTLVAVLITWLNVSRRRSAAERAVLLEREQAARREAELERVRLRAIFQGAPAFIGLFQGPEFVCVLHNIPDAEPLAGREVLGLPLRRALPEARRLLEQVEHVYRTGQVVSSREAAARLPQPDGTTRELFFNVCYQPTFDLQGRVEGVAVFASDVTELVLARRRAEAAEQSLQRLADSIPAIVWSAGPDGVNDYYNRPWYEYTGIPQGSLDFALVTRVTHPEDLATHARRWSECLGRGEPFQGEFRLLRASDQTWRWHLTRTVPWKDASGRVAKWFGTSIDIDEQKHNEHQLQLLAGNGAVLGTSLDEAETLSVAARLAVPAFADWCLVDLQQPDGTFQRVQAVHAAAEDAELARHVLRFGPVLEGNPRYPPTEALLRGKTLLIERFTPERLARIGHTEEHSRMLRQAGLVSCIAVPLVARGATLGVMSFFTSRSGRHYTAADRSFAEALARRASLAVDNARLYKSAQEAVRLRDEFLSVASHELKTPLTPLSLKLQGLVRKASAQPDSLLAREVLKDVEMGHKQVRKLGELIGDLLDVSRISAGRLKLACEPVDFAALLREVTSRHEAQAAGQGTALHVEAPASLVGTWDPRRLEQVVVNLLSNALKYGPGKPISLRLKEDSGNAILAVKDEGIGIAPQAQGRIFERFMRAVSDRHYGGLGLGLYITKSCVEAMGGTIQVQSEPDKGATFTVMLPRHTPA